jgi:hypothetical protein
MARKFIMLLNISSTKSHLEAVEGINRRCSKWSTHRVLNNLFIYLFMKLKNDLTTCNILFPIVPPKIYFYFQL